MVFKNEESVNAIKEPYDTDGDGHESVSEYIEKKKITTDNGETKEEQNVEKKNKNEQDLEKVKNTVGRVGNAIGNVASVVTAIPHVAAIGLGAGSASLAKMFADYLKDKAQKNNGKTK